MKQILFALPNKNISFTDSVCPADLQAISYTSAPGIFNLLYAVLVSTFLQHI